jgi:hypothetical protein
MRANHCTRQALPLTPVSLSLLHRSLSTVDDMLSRRIDSNVDDGTRLACTFPAVQGEPSSSLNLATF